MRSYAEGIPQTGISRLSKIQMSLLVSPSKTRLVKAIPIPFIIYLNGT